MGGVGQETIDGVFRFSPSGAWDPMYLNYTFGTLLSLELRHEMELRPGFTLKRFHDALLYCGTLPIPLIRELIG